MAVIAAVTARAAAIRITIRIVINIVMISRIIISNTVETSKTADIGPAVVAEQGRD